MQILYIIGNGFDLNLGLKTSYRDFYEYYKEIESSNFSIVKLKNNISETYESWADLELAIGDYTQNLNTQEEFDDVHFDIGEKLSEYLYKEEDSLKDREFDKNKFIDYLVFPENLFLPVDKEIIELHKVKWDKHDWQLNIYTFNYTSIIEKILGEVYKGSVISVRRNKLSVRFGEIKHIHGFIDRDMVIGVNDTSQVKNLEFHNNRDVLESLIKSNCNQANKNNVDSQFANKIKYANLICIFGSSLGATDNKWWEQIGERLKSNCFLIIFSKGAEIPSRVRYMQARKERAMKEIFLNKTKLSEEEKEMVRDKIFVGINTDMFNGILK